MKKQNFTRISLLVLAVMAVSACSPFGNQSLIQDISSEIGVFIPGKTSTSVISSASSSVTASGYLVTHSVGDTYQQGDAVSGTMQMSGQTGSGYKVFSSISGDVQ